MAENLGQKLKVNELINLMVNYAGNVYTKTGSFKKVQPIMLWGSPGIGKSQAMGQVVEKLGKKFSKKTPLLIMHGLADWRVNPTDSFRLAQKLYEKKIPYRLIMFEGADHAISEYLETRNKYTFEWLDRFLKQNEPLPILKPHGE